MRPARTFYFLYYLIILNEIPTQTTTTETRITYTTSTNNQFWTLHQNGLNKTSCLIIIDLNRYYTTAISSCSLSWHNDLKKKSTLMMMLCICLDQIYTPISKHTHHYFHITQTPPPPHCRLSYHPNTHQTLSLISHITPTTTDGSAYTFLYACVEYYLEFEN